MCPCCVCLTFLEQQDVDLDVEFDVHLGIAHTRWATHGVPSPVNSHPHRSDKTNGQLCRGQNASSLCTAEHQMMHYSTTVTIIRIIWWIFFLMFLSTSSFVMLGTDILIFKVIFLVCRVHCHPQWNHHQLQRPEEILGEHISFVNCKLQVLLSFCQ